MNREGISFLNESRNLIPNEDPTPKKGRNVRRVSSGASRELQVTPSTRPKTNGAPGIDVAPAAPEAFEDFLQSSWSASPPQHSVAEKRSSADGEMQTRRGPASTPPTERPAFSATPEKSRGFNILLGRVISNAIGGGESAPSLTTSETPGAFATTESVSEHSRPTNSPATRQESDAVAGQAQPHRGIEATSTPGNPSASAGNTPTEDARSFASSSIGLSNDAAHDTEIEVADESSPTLATIVNQDQPEGASAALPSKATSEGGASGRVPAPEAPRFGISNGAGQISTDSKDFGQVASGTTGAESRSEASTLADDSVTARGGEAQIPTASRLAPGSDPQEATAHRVESLDGTDATSGDPWMAKSEPSMPPEPGNGARPLGDSALMSREKSPVVPSRPNEVASDSRNAAPSSHAHVQAPQASLLDADVLDHSATHRNGERSASSSDSRLHVDEGSEASWQPPSEQDSESAFIPATDGQPAQAVRSATMTPGELESVPAVGSSPRSDSAFVARTEAPAPTSRPVPPEPLEWTPRVLHDLASKARDFLAKGHTEIRLRLDPPHLGKLRVRLDISEGKIAAHLLASSSETAALLERDRQELVRAFEAQGISEVSVEVDSDSSEGFASWFEERENDSPRTPAPALPDATQSRSPRGRSRSLVDVVA